MARSIVSQSEQYGLPHREAADLPPAHEFADFLGGHRTMAGLMKREAAGGQPIPGGQTDNMAPPTNQVPSSSKTGPGGTGFGPTAPPGDMLPDGPAPGVPQGPGIQNPASQMSFQSAIRQAAGGDVFGDSSATGGIPGVRPIGPGNPMGPGLSGGGAGTASGVLSGGGTSGGGLPPGMGIGGPGPMKSPQQGEQPGGSDLQQGPFAHPGDPGKPNLPDPLIPWNDSSPSEHESANRAKSWYRPQI